MTRILIVRLGALGDIVHAIPVAAALRRAWPGARIDWLVSSKHRELLDLVPVIDRRLVINDRPGTGVRTARGEASPTTTMLSAIGELRRAHYDVALDLQGLLKSAVLARMSGATRVVGFSSSYLREPLARAFYTEVHEPKGIAHVLFQNLSLLDALGLTVTTPEFPIEPTDSAIARDLQERTRGRYALVNPGAAWPNKRWPPSRFGAVASALRERHGLMSVVPWGPGEHPIAEELVASSSGAAILSPPTSIADLVALARGAALMISGDTGPTHIAAAVGTPIVGLFGPTRPARNGPWAPEDIAVSRDAICECHHLRRCRRSTMCLMDVEVAEVVDACARRLAVEPPRG